MHVGVALQREQLRHPHAADAAAAPEVVAQEVDDHQVLGAVLRAAEQVVGVRLILVRGQTARARALDRAGLHLALAQADEALGGQADDRAGFQRQVAREGRRTGTAQ